MPIDLNIDDLAAALNENEQDKKLRDLLIDWEHKLAPISLEQQDMIEKLEQIHREAYFNADDYPSDQEDDKIKKNIHVPEIPSESLKSLINKPEDQEHSFIEDPTEFSKFYESVDNEIHNQSYDKYRFYANELLHRRQECDQILSQIDVSTSRLDHLRKQYEFVANKTNALNVISEKLTDDQNQLNEKSEEIKRRLYYFNQAEIITNKLQSPTLSVASDTFRDCLNKIDECLDYLKHNAKFKESQNYTVKYKHCMAKAITLMKNYVNQIMAQAIESVTAPTKVPNSHNLTAETSSDAAFALYYGKFQTTAIKIKKISAMIEERINKSPEYEQLLSEIHQSFLTVRASLMSPAVENAIKDLKIQNKNDHCTLMRSACAFLVHVCQDEYRLFYQFFTIVTEQLNSYLEGLCTILYDTLRPYIIHIIHLETLAEICGILRIEMIEEHVQQNPEPLEAFGKTAFKLLQDVQERLVFRASLYLQSDILNYNPSAGDLAYPDKLEMMESIALSLQEPPLLKRSDSRASMISSVSSTIPDTESVIVDNSRGRFINSPADLHGMWYPTVRRTLVCLSRLYRCIDRPIFQGLSQEAISHCVQSVSTAAQKITAQKTPVDGELFEIKHLLILREQIAPFRVDFTVKETQLDFSKVKTAAYGLIQKRKQLFSMGSNNAILEFLLDGTPMVKELVKDSRKDVDRQLKTICELFIKDAVEMLVGPVLAFLEKAQQVVTSGATTTSATTQSSQKINYELRQSSWASPQQISSYIQESQRLIKSKLACLQRSMQLYLSNRDTEFIIFRPIRNNVINVFVKLEQILTTNGYSAEDMIITSCPTADQVAILISSASLVADAQQQTIIAASRKFSTSNDASNNRKISVEKKVSFDNSHVVKEEVLNYNLTTKSTERAEDSSSKEISTIK